MASAVAGADSAWSEVLEGDEVEKSGKATPGLASLKDAITKAAVTLLVSCLSFTSWVTILFLKDRRSAATPRINLATRGRLCRCGSSTGASVGRFSRLTRVVAKSQAASTSAKPSWLSRRSLDSSVDAWELAWISF